nr:RING-box protein 2 isoform X2 [Pogona vitticeps]
MADVEDGEEAGVSASPAGSSGSKTGGVDKMFSLKKWNAVAMWSWDVECDTCAICRVQVMDACLRCQAENKQEDCVGHDQDNFVYREKILPYTQLPFGLHHLPVSEGCLTL